MTLTQVAVLTKQIITLTIIVIFVGIVGFIGYRIWYTSYLASLPPQEEKPDTKFGLLPQIDFPSSAVSSSNFSYSVDTSTGNLPKVGIDSGFEKLVKVYFVTKTLTTLLSAERSHALAEKLGITNAPEILSDTKYRFRNDGKTLTVELDNGNFTFVNTSVSQSNENIDEDSRLISDFKSNLDNLVGLKQDLLVGPSKVIPRSNETNAATISLWPVPIDNRPILTSQFNISTIVASVQRSASNINNYLSINYIYYPVDTSIFATYPIKSTEDAFADLKNGKGVVIIEGEKPQISITSVYLAYYSENNYSPYLQPIFVFEGSHFVAYVPAVKSEFVETK